MNNIENTQDFEDFNPLNPKELIEILGASIKKDEQNKLVTFLCLLLTYTDTSQFNISFNAPSASGKSYIPTEIAKYFPQEDVIEIGYCSPSAFFHDTGSYDKKNNRYTVDLANKILIFLDQPHNMLLERLRPLFSHDKKELHLKITDKTQKGGLKTKNVVLKGFPSAIFCSAGMKIDEQETTRFLLLSPETTQEKIRQGILEKIKKDANVEKYMIEMANAPGREALMQRIQAIKQAGIKEIIINDTEFITNEYFSRRSRLKPRHQRDIGRLISIIKGFALLNWFEREKDEQNIIASSDDIKEGIILWETLAESQEYGIPPFAYGIYSEVILPAFSEKNINSTRFLKGLERLEIHQKYYSVHGRGLAPDQLRLQIIPMLESCGLIRQEKDGRKMLVYPNTNQKNNNDFNNSE